MIDSPGTAFDFKVRGWLWLKPGLEAGGLRINCFGRAEVKLGFWKDTELIIRDCELLDIESVDSYLELWKFCCD